MASRLATRGSLPSGGLGIGQPHLKPADLDYRRADPGYYNVKKRQQRRLATGRDRVPPGAVNTIVRLRDKSSCRHRAQARKFADRFRAAQRHSM